MTGMGYAYEHVGELFQLSTWDKDIERQFGLQGDWDEFGQYVNELKASARPGETIKVIYTARHGEAEHNVLAKKHGLPDGDALQQRFPIIDPLLTPAGRAQAIRLNRIFQAEAAQGMPLPTRWFVSPMRRPGETCGLEWGWLFGHDASKAAQVDGCLVDSGNAAVAMGWGVPGECIEELREHLHVNQCDKRLPLSQLRTLFPTFDFPDTMTEEDTVWSPTGRETEDEMVARAGRGLAIVMDKSWDDTYISVTSHSGFLRAVYKNLGVPARRLETGEMNVLVVRARRV